MKRQNQTPCTLTRGHLHARSIGALVSEGERRGPRVPAPVRPLGSSGAFSKALPAPGWVSVFPSVILRLPVWLPLPFKIPWVFWVAFDGLEASGCEGGADEGRGARQAEGCGAGSCRGPGMHPGGAGQGPVNGEGEGFPACARQRPGAAG